ncbi:MAG: MFS transporter [Nitrolancea sp.]
MNVVRDDVSTAETTASARFALRRARFAVGSLFFIQGFVAANWFVRIPAIKDRLHLSTSALGVSLLSLTVGLLIAMPIIGWLLTRVGSRVVCGATVLTFFVTPVLPALAVNQITLMLGLLVFGGVAGMLDVSMNVQGVAVEERMGRPVMSSFHGMYSAGGIAGSIIGGGLAALGLSPRLHLFIIGATFGLFGAYVSRWLVAESPSEHKTGPVFVRPTRALATLGVIAFCALLNEGAMSDWSAVYLRDSIGTGAGLAAAGFAVFSVTMTAGRLLGDRWAERLGAPALMRIGGLVAAVGLGLSLTFSSLPATLIGFACVGAGMSFVFPLTVSAASRSGGMAPGPSIAAISTAGYTGLLAGPSLIGLSADVLTLRGALGIVVVLGVLITLLAGAARRGAPSGGVG